MKHRRIIIAAVLLVLFVAGVSLTLWLRHLAKPDLADLRKEEPPLNAIQLPLKDVWGGCTAQGWSGLDALVQVTDREGTKYNFYFPHSGIPGKQAYPQVLLSRPFVRGPDGDYTRPHSGVPMKDPARAKEICLLLLKSHEPGKPVHHMYYTLQSEGPPVPFMNKLRRWLRIP